MGNNKKGNDLYKKWWFWLIICLTILVVVFVTYKIIEEQKIRKSMENMAEGAADFYKGTQNANSYLDKFTYNSITGNVDYNP